ncbi:hypothetical protein BOTBODRAFT_56116 [Botryobasidium botryosum FD-172 SS1]|uniref:Uncharacterized protein n=1 Tax=Botryobasidium botryosum (strain FD-172 SS1) TaxID=930990 RepID=A0A067MNX8_BOTB1|nr:hypothetical protein BOTBODRAFT_56116 [Botryobasidium botryosum FD-172 SS1]
MEPERCLGASAPRHTMLSLAQMIGTLACAIAPAVAVRTPACRTPSVRKDWRALGYSGQKAFVDAIKCMSTTPIAPVYHLPGPPQDCGQLMQIALATMI